MIIGKIFREIFMNNIAIIVTSNRSPEELYKNGLQREKFLPFVDLIQEKMEILHLDNQLDYRLGKIKSIKQHYLFPINEDNSKLLKKIFSNMTDYGNLVPKELDIKGRKLLLKDTYNDILWVEFKEIFEKPLGSEDYMEICKNFSIVFVNNVPRFSLEQRNEAKRFNNFIDIMYDNHNLLIALCEVSPEKLYEKGDGVFEFKRVISRLNEMQSESYVMNSKKGKLRWK